MPTIVESKQNERVRWVRRVATERKARQREGLWLAEGVRLSEEVLTGSQPVRLWVVEEGWQDSSARAERLWAGIQAREDPTLLVRRGLLREISDTRTPQGVLALLTAPTWGPADVLAGDRPVVLLDRVQDPGNLGTIARIAEGAGAGGLLLTRGSTDPGNPKALRASAGALLRLPVCMTEDPVSLLKTTGRALVATSGQEGEPYDRLDWRVPFALLLGQEGGGLSPALGARADRFVTIPMAGRLESLNVASACAVILFEAARQARAAGGAPP